MPKVLRFGIHSLDELLGTHPDQPRAGGEGGQPSGEHCGIYLLKEKDRKKADPRKQEAGDENAGPQSAAAKQTITTSICLIGPSGTGKSIFGLHMASTYLADCLRDDRDRDDPDRRRLPAVLYVSTDLTYNMACLAWNNFALDRPFSRRDPFGPHREPEDRDDRIELRHFEPTALAKNFEQVEAEVHRGHVIFVDMASYTAGDDWGFLHKLLALLPLPEGDEEPRHLVVVDAIEGFEALAGEVNAFGEKSTRRSRVAQMMRLVEGKCHALLVVEKGGGEEQLAEEFVADTVIRLENRSIRDYERRLLKVEKVRGQSHIRGHHHYSIRSGGGSTTGHQSNPDDPEVEIAPAPSDSDRRRRLQSYVQIYPSVHRVNRQIMEIRGERSRTRVGPGPDKFAAFGIKYLDNMLGGKEETTGRGIDANGLYYDTRGLPCSTATAIIGDSLTQKSTLGKAFLSRCFHSFPERLKKRREAMDEGGVEKIWGHIREKVELLFGSALPRELEEAAKPLIEKREWSGLCRRIGDEIRKKLGAKIGVEQMPFLSRLVAEDEPESRPMTEEEVLTHLAAWTLDYKSGQAVMLVTHNTHHARLAREFVGWLHPQEELKRLNEEMPDYEEALENYIMGGTICRRLEIHSMSSEVMIHIVQQLISAAQRKVLTPEQMLRPAERYNNSWPIRVVIDDFSTFRDIFPELREDPLMLPSILFHFEREGVTTLIIDTQSGKPEAPIAERFESELRQMVQHNLYTWRFPFYGESRVAITAIPPFSHEYAGIVRELRWESGTQGRQSSPSENEPATVDPHFELYSGLEEGRPQPVPLAVRFYAETPATESYIEVENNLLGGLFVPAARQAQAGGASVILGVPVTDYNDLRDYSYLQRETRLDHTLVFQVDEFWALRVPDRRKRSGTSHSQWSYLNAVTAHDAEPDLNVDPYQLFQPREDADNKSPRRKDFFEGYFDEPDYSHVPWFDTPEVKDKYHVDRVPFTWDFGFLLCQERAWKTSRHVRLGVREEGEQAVTPPEEYTVEKVWNRLRKARVDQKDEEEYVSWRLFIEACKKAAEGLSDKLSKQVTAFDFSQNSPESFSCLTLEMWFSEIYDTLYWKKMNGRDEREKAEAKRDLEKFLGAVSKRRLFTPLPGVPPAPGGGDESPQSLSKLLGLHWLELYKSWLLLIEVINFSDIMGGATALDFDFKSKPVDFAAVASRHWYKTAAQCPNDIATKESLVAVRLPGHFSTRGDWFLAVAGSSRSVRQGERALDLLSSRRANVERLQSGVGLPTRFSAGESVKKLRTKLVSHERGQDNVEYETFLKLKAENSGRGDEGDFYWLWRSSLADYVHSNRIWHKWLNRMLLSWHRNLLRYRSVWRNSFEIYDELTGRQREEKPLQNIKDFAPEDAELKEMLDKWKVLREEGEPNKDSPEQYEGSPETYEKSMSDYLKQYRVKSLAQLIVRVRFRTLWEVLLEELSQASGAARGASEAARQV
jgi:KaiC